MADVESSSQDEEQEEAEGDDGVVDVLAAGTSPCTVHYRDKAGAVWLVWLDLATDV